MESLQQELEAFFTAFYRDEAFDAEAWRRTLQESLERLKPRLDHIDQADETAQAALQENAILRRVLADDCAAKLLLLGYEDADKHAAELAALDAAALAARREEIVREFDGHFRVIYAGDSAHREGGQPHAAECRAPGDVRAFEI